MSESSKISTTNKVMLFLLALITNFSLIYVITLNEIFGYVAIVILGASLTLLFLNRSNKSAFSDKDVPRPGMLDSIKLIRNYIGINKKYIVATALGLIISCLVISQSVIVVNSYQQYAFEQYVSGSDTRAYSLDISDASLEQFDEWETMIEEKYQTWMDNPAFNAPKSQTYPTASFELMLGNHTTTATKYVDTKTMTSRQMTKEHFNLFKDLPSFPDISYEETDSLMIIPASLTFPLPELGVINYNIFDWVVEEEDDYIFNILVDIPEKPINAPVPFFNHSESVDEIFRWGSEDFAYIRDNDMKIPDKLLAGTVFLPEGRTFTLVNNLIQKANSNGLSDYFWGKTGFESYLTIDLPKVADSPLKDILNGLEDMSNNIKQDLLGYITTSIPPYKDNVEVKYSLYSPLHTIVEEYLGYSNSFMSLLQISLTPLVITSLFLFYFALSIIDNRKKRIFKKFKVRGATNGQIQKFVFSEVFVYGLIAPILGGLISLWSTPLILDFIAVLNPETNIEMLIPDQLKWQLPAIGFLLAMNFNLQNLYNVYKIKTEEEREEMSQTDSNIESGYYDLILFGLAMFYWIFTPYISIPQNFQVIVYKYMGYLALGITFISLPLVVSRYFIGAIDKILPYFSKKFDLLKLAIKSIQKNNKFTRKLITLLLLTLMFSYLGIISSTTIIDTNEDLSQYHIGSDIYVSGLNTEDNTTMTKFLEVEGIEQYSEIYHMTYRPNGNEVQPGLNIDDAKTYQFLGINPSTFTEVVKWDETFSKKSLKELTSQLEKKKSIAVQEDIAEIFDYEIGEDFNLNYGFQGQRNYTMDITGTYKYFPQHVFKTYEGANLNPSDVETLNFVTNLETIKELGQQTIRRVAKGLIIDVKDGYDPVEISNSIHEALLDEPNLTVKNIKEDKVSLFAAEGDAGEQSPLAKYEESFLQSSLLSLIIVSLIVTIIGVIYFSFITMSERRKEIGIYRALGMVENQIVKLLIIELFLLVITAVLIGSIFGLFLASNIFTVITGNVSATTPPFDIVIPHLWMFVYSFIISVLAILIAFIPSINVARKQTGNILRAT